MKKDLPERSFLFAVNIVNLCKELQKNTGLSSVLIKQLLRSGTSVGANIEEGQSSQSEADFLSKYSISCKECRETQYWLRLIKVTEPSCKDFEHIINEANELIAILTSIIKKLKEKKLRCIENNKECVVNVL
jgi:four helix bundle protein